MLRPMMRWVKRALIEMSVGAVLGFILWCLAGKRLTSLMFGSLGGSFSCANDVSLGLDKFVSMQLYSAIGGALIIFLGATLFRRWLAKLKAGQVARTPGPIA
jgi:Mg/Co/Ni transporter MgtE